MRKKIINPFAMKKYLTFILILILYNSYHCVKAQTIDIKVFQVDTFAIKGLPEQPILKIKINTGTSESFTLQRIVIKSESDNNANISKIKIFKTKYDRFSKADYPSEYSSLIDGGVSLIGDSAVFEGLTLALAAGDNYFWVVFDQVIESNPGDKLDASIRAGGITISGTNHPLELQSPDGSSVIRQKYFFDSFEKYEKNTLRPLDWTVSYPTGDGNAKWECVKGGYEGNPTDPKSGKLNARSDAEYLPGRVSRLISKPLNLSVSTKPMLTFYHAQAYMEDNDINDSLGVYYGFSTTGPWHFITNYTQPTPGYSWKKREVNLPDEMRMNNVYLVFKSTAQYGHGVCIDSVTIYESQESVRTVEFISATHPSLSNVPQGTLKSAILRLNIGVKGNKDYNYFTSITINSLNTSDNDIGSNGINFYATRDSVFASPVLLGTGSFSGGKVTFNGFSRRLESGDNYFWVTYDITEGATPDNFLDAKIVYGDIVINDGKTYPSVELSPEGSRQIKQSIFFDDFEDLSKGWDLQGDFEIGKPKSLGGNAFSFSDPPAAYSRDQVLGNDLSSDGNYGNNKINIATSPLIQAKYFKNIMLNYARWLNAEQPDSVSIEYQYEGESVWHNFWSPSSSIIDGSWTIKSSSVKALFDRKNFQIRFKLGQTSIIDQYSGWNIDYFFLSGDSVKYDAAVTEYIGPLSKCGLTSNEKIQIKIKNTGPKVLSNIPVKLSLDGGVNWIQSILSENLNIDETKVFEFPGVDLSKNKIYNVIAKVVYPGDNYSDNDSIMYDLTSVPTYSLPYYDGFEKDTSFWLTGGINSSWIKGTPNYTSFGSAYEGDNCWKTGSSFSNLKEDSYVMSPCFNLSDVEKPVVDLRYKYQMENLVKAGARMEYSLDGGTNWSYLPAYNDPFNWDWYNDSVRVFNDKTIGWVDQSIEDNSFVWLNGKEILPSIANKSLVRLRFHYLDTSKLTVFRGLGFDAFNLMNAPYNAKVSTIDNVNSPACQYGENSNSDKIKITLENIGIRKIRTNDSLIVGIKVNTNPVVIDTFKLLSDMAVGATRQFTMTKPVNLTDPGNYDIKAFVINKYPSFYGDQDTASLNITVYTNPLTSLPDTIFTARRDTLKINTIQDGSYAYEWKYGGSVVGATYQINAATTGYGSHALKVSDANCTTRDTVYVKHLIPDVGVTAILSPTDDCGYKAPLAPVIRIKNFGTDTLRANQTIPVKIRLNEDADLSDVITLTEKFAPGDVLEKPLVKALNLMTPQTNKLKIWTELAYDDTTRNDTTILSFVIKGYPHVFLGNDTTIKGKLTYELNAGTFASYLWNDASTDQKLTITKPGYYSVTVTDANTCSNADTIHVHMVIHDLKMQKLLAPLTSCMQTTATQIKCQIKNVGTDTIKTSETITIFYQMNGGSINAETITAPVELKPNDSLQHTFTPTQNLAAKGIYSFKIKSTIAGDIQPLNDSLMQDVEIWGNPNIDLGTPGIKRALSYTLYPGKYQKYLWQDGTQDSTWVITKNKFQDGRTYSVTVTDDHGCIGSDTKYIKLEVYDLEISAFLLPRENCKISANMTIKNAGNEPLNRLAELSYTLNGKSYERDTVLVSLPAGVTQEHNFNIPYDISTKGDYTFKAALKMEDDIQPLNDTGTFVTNVKAYPNVDFGDDTLIVELPYNLKVKDDYFAYKWQAETSFDTAKYEYPIFKEEYDPNNPKYTVTVQDSNKCELPPVSVVVIGLYYDLAVTGISNPLNSCIFTPQKLDAVIKNNSTLDLKDKNIDLQYSINNGTVVTKNVSLSILRGESKTVEFDETLDLPSAGNYETILKLNYTEDMETGNNGDTAVIKVLGNPAFSFTADTFKTSAFPYTIDAGTGYQSYTWSDNTPGQTYNASAEGLYRVTVTDNNNCTAKDSVYVKLTTGFRDLEDIGDIKLYPNPVSNYLNVEINLDDKQDIILDIISTEGKIVYRKSLDKISEFKGDVDVSGLPKGLYYIRISSKEAVMSKKIVVK
jgi:hypothetical protein